MLHSNTTRKTRILVSPCPLGLPTFRNCPCIIMESYLDVFPNRYVDEQFFCCKRTIFVSNIPWDCQPLQANLHCSNHQRTCLFYS